MPEKHILILDHEEGHALATAAFLEARHYKVDVAHKGVDFMEKLSQYPDLVLLNRGLKDIGGLEVCRAIRQDRRLAHVSIIVYDSSHDPADRVQGLSTGADDYLSRPIDEEELVARIEAVLRRNQVFRQVQEEKGALAMELRAILRNEMITPYFQPIYSMKTLTPMGLEALSRPPTTGLIDNAEFLFRTALILDMYSEVEMLCWKVDVTQWRLKINRGKLFLNCTPYFIESGRLTRSFLEGLNVDPANIVLEITERTAIQRHETFLKELQALRGLGIQVAVDDVGSGFASLDIVVDIRPEIVKIDRQLVRELHKDELRYNIVHGIVSFCKKSRILTVAEGIEEEKELDAVQELGIDAVQGYLMARPSPDIDPDIFSKKFGEGH